MRIHVSFIDRVGITQEVLALLGARNLNLDAVEMVPPNVYIDAPTLSPAVLEELHDALFEVHGVQSVEVVDILPGQRRHLQLDALLAAMSDPVLAVDSAGKVLLANPALIALCGRESAGRTVGELFNDPELLQALLDNNFRLPMREMQLHGQSLLLDATPITHAGGLLTLYAPSRMGERLSALHHDHAEGFDALLGESPAIRTLKARALRVAALDAPLLVHGETGTGKELVARACHAISSRQASPFLALNCAALPESLAESELFGYAPGAFTGAQRGGKPGLMELANQGTVFLDEIGEMSPYLQAKLLRFLSDGSFRRVGGDREVKVDVRIISATHRDLLERVAQGSFREDLYYRLNGLELTLPAVRERTDKEALLDVLLRQEAHGQVVNLAADARRALLDFAWPGNVRQLRNVLRTLIALCDGSCVRFSDLPAIIRANQATEKAALPCETPRSGYRSAGSGTEVLQDAEREALIATLEAKHWHLTRVAEHLGISRNTLYRKLRKHGINRGA